MNPSRNFESVFNKEFKKKVVKCISLKEEFEEAVKKKSLLFCNSSTECKKIQPQIYEKCKICQKNFCEICKEFCHDKKCKNYVNDPIPFFTVTEYFSCCDCTHRQKSSRINNEFFSIGCFFSDFLTKEFEIKKKFFRNKENPNKILCFYCYENCAIKQKFPKKGNNPNESNYLPLNDDNLNYQICTCEDDLFCHMNFENRLNFFRKCFIKDKRKKIINYLDIKDRLEKEMKKYFENRQFIESEVIKFCIYLLIFKTNVDVDERDEIKLLLFLVKKLTGINSIKNYPLSNCDKNVIKQRDTFYFNNQKINLVLTYLYYFYKKKLFSKVKMVGAKYISVLPLDKRIDIAKRNRRIRESLFNKNFNNEDNETGEIFDINLVKIIMNALNELPDYTIKLSDVEQDVPFKIFFLKSFIHSYSYEEKGVNEFLKLLMRIDYKEKYNEFNHMIRSLIDEAYFICQVYTIDLVCDQLIVQDNVYLQGEVQKNFSDPSLIIRDGIHFDNLINLFYSSKSYESDVHCIPDDFQIYFNKIFENKKIGHRQTGIEEKKQKKEIFQFLKSLNEDILYYFDIFNNDFTRKMLTKSKDEYKTFNFDVIYDKNNEKNFDLDKNDLGFFDHFIIEINNCKKIQEETLQNYINKILNAYGLNIKCENEDEFLEEAFMQIRLNNQSRGTQDKPKNHIVFPNYLDENKKSFRLDLDSVNLKIFEKELLYIFYLIFCCEYHKVPIFQKILFNWNKLLLLFLSNKENVKYLLLDLKFLNFLFDTKIPIQDGNSRKSFLIRSLYNQNKNVKENNLTWKCFYYLYLYFINKNEELEYLKSNILKSFVNEVINFYLIQYKKDNMVKDLISIEKNSSLDKMNYPVIYYFLRIVERMILRDNLNLLNPFGFNVNKFETLEKINLIAEILFKERFNMGKFFSSYKFIKNRDTQSCDINQNLNFSNSAINKGNITDNTILSGGEEINGLIDDQENIDNGKDIFPHICKGNDKEEYNAIINKKKNLQTLQFLLLNIMGNFYTSYDLDVYFKILNDNLEIFVDFLKNKETYFSFENIQINEIKQIVYRLEVAILKFLLNFLMIKHYNYSKVDILNDVDLTEKDMMLFGSIAKDFPYFKIPNKINTQKMSFIDKYQIHKMKLNILEHLTEYIGKFKSEFYKIQSDSDDIRNKDLASYLLNTFTLMLKENYIKKNQGKILINYEEKFFGLLQTFYENLKNFNFSENDSLFEDLEKEIKNNQDKIYYNESGNEKEEHFNLKKKTDFFKKYKDFFYKFSRIPLKKMKNARNLEEIRKELEKKDESNFIVQITNKIKDQSCMFDGSAKKIKKYFEDFLLFDTREHSMYNRLIRKISNHSKNIDEENLDVYVRDHIKTEENYDNQRQNFENLNYIFFKSSKCETLQQFEKYKELHRKFWMKVNEKFLNRSSNMEIEQLLDYMFSHLQLLESGKYFINSFNFELIFSESFIKTINFLNNILYYRPVEVQRYLHKNLTEDQMIILLKNVIKLGNYIIGISEFENNEKLFASSKIYFIMMDFFILLTEGMYEGDTQDYFFMNLKLDKEEKEEENISLEEIIKENQEKENKEKDKKTLPRFFSNMNMIKKFKENPENDLEELKISIEEENLRIGEKPKKKVFQISQFFKPLIKKSLESSNFSEKLCNSLNPFDMIIKMKKKEEKNKDIGLNNLIIKTDELDDSTTLNDNYESLKNKVSNLGEWTAKKIKMHIPEMINDFSYLFSINKNLFDYSNYDDLNAIQTISGHYQYLFQISNLIFDQLLIYSKKIYDKTYYREMKKIKDLKDVPHSKITNKTLLNNLVKSIEDFFDPPNDEKLSQEYMVDKLKNYFEKISKILENFDKFSNDFKGHLLDDSISEDDLNNFFCEIHNEYLLNLKNYFETLESELFEVIKVKGENELNDKNDLLLTKGIDVRELQPILINPKMETLEILNENINEENNDLEDIIVCNIPEEKDEKEKINKHEKELKDEDYKDNFFYLNFLQLKRIMELINTFKYKNFSHGSERLILQFLYITRFLKEFLELDESEKNKNNRKIVTFCFNSIFDFNWIISDKLYNEKYSFIIRLGCLNLLNAYLEENIEDLDKEFNKKIFNDLHSYKNIFKEIVKCFKDSNGLYSCKNINHSDVLFFNYIKDEKNLYKTENFELAESYYKLLRLIEPFYQDFLAKYSLEDKHELEEFYLLKRRNLKTKEILNQSSKNHFHVDDKKENLLCKIREEEEFFKDCAFFLKRIGKEIEIKFENSNKKFVYRKIYFFKSPKCYWAPKSLKNTFFDTCQRKSIGTKLDGLNNTIDRFLLNICLCYKYRMIKSYVSSLSIAKLYKTFNPQYINSINFCFVFALNVLLLFYFFIDTNKMDPGELNTMMPLYKGNKIFFSRLDIIYIFSIALAFIQAILVGFWYIFRFNIRLSNILFGENEIVNYYMIKKYRDEEDFVSNGFDAYRNMVKIYEDINHPLIKVKIFDLKSAFIFISYRLSAIMFNPEIFYLFWSFIFTIIYLITNYKLLLVLQILSVINLYPLFSYFLTSLVNKSQQFIAILLFIYFILYVFSWITFLHFQEFMIGEYIPRNGDKLESEGKKELLCSTAIECFLNYIDLGLRLGGGMGDSAARVSFKFDTTKNFVKKIVWDVVFHIIVNLILANIFFGIIVDTFNELRDERELNEDDKKNYCFMCDLERFDNKAISEDFDVHRSVKHKVSNYIYVIPYLLNKNPQEYSRAEQYVWTQINIKKIDWFPSPVDASPVVEKKN